MKILFVSSNHLKRVMPPMPLGLASIIATIDASRHEIQVLDLMFSEKPEAELESLLADFAPENSLIQRISFRCHGAARRIVA